MKPAQASAVDDLNPEETYRMPRLACERRERRWRTVAALSQWVALTAFTVAMGFAACHLQHGGADRDPVAKYLHADPERTEVERAHSEAPKIGSEAEQYLADGRRLLRQGQLQSAELAFRHALALRHDHPRALLGLARLYLARGDIDRARGFARAAVNRAPDHAPNHGMHDDALRVVSDRVAR